MQITFDQTTHTYTDEAGVRLPSVTQILKGAGLVDYSMYAGAEYAAARGTAVHIACQYWDEGDLDYDQLDPELIGYVDAWVRFREDSGFIPELIEHRISCESPRYAGMLDRYGRVNSAEWLVDIKTGTPHPATAIQTAAYAEALGKLGQCKRRAVYLRNNGMYSLEAHNSDVRDWGVFRAAYTTYQWKQENKLGGKEE